MDKLCKFLCEARVTPSDSLHRGFCLRKLDRVREQRAARRAASSCAREEDDVKIAVDTCVGRRGRALENAGHKVLVEADQGEMDHVWFGRALKAAVDGWLLVSALQCGCAHS